MQYISSHLCIHGVDYTPRTLPTCSTPSAMFGYTVVCCYRIVSQRGGIESYSILCLRYVSVEITKVPRLRYPRTSKNQSVFVLIFVTEPSAEYVLTRGVYAREHIGRSSWAIFSVHLSGWSVKCRKGAVTLHSEPKLSSFLSCAR